MMQIEVELTEPDSEGYGFAVAGHDGSGKFHISKIRTPNSSASVSSLLIGDKLITINGNPVSKSHDEVCKVISDSKSLVLTIDRDSTGKYTDDQSQQPQDVNDFKSITPSEDGDKNETKPAVIQIGSVTINKTDGRFGFWVATTDHGVVVADISSDTAKAKLQVDDTIYSINNESVDGKVHDDVLAMFNIITESIELQVGRAQNSKLSRTLHNNIIPIGTVTITKVDDIFGVSVATLDNIVVVTGSSDRHVQSNTLLVDDVIYSIDGDSVLGKSHDEVIAMITNPNSDSITLDVGRKRPGSITNQKCWSPFSFFVDGKKHFNY